jgi:hypothetical protein
MMINGENYRFDIHHSNENKSIALLRVEGLKASLRPVPFQTFSATSLTMLCRCSVGQELRQVMLSSAEYQLHVLEKYFIQFVTNLQRESGNFNVICKKLASHFILTLLFVQQYIFSTFFKQWNLMMGDPGVDGRIILRWIFRKWDVEACTGFIWLRKGTGGGLL